MAPVAGRPTKGYDMSVKWAIVPRCGLLASAFLLCGALLAMGSTGYLPPEAEGARRVAQLAADRELITLALWVAVLSISANVILVRWLLANTIRQTIALEKMASKPCLFEKQ
jgi:hypothetical protein